MEMSVLSVTALGQRVDVVPDAVVRSPSQKRRVFVELDRSMKNLGRIRECLDRYVTVLGHLELGGDARTVLFVVRSAARKRHIQQLTKLLPLVVLEEAEAAPWLREHLGCDTPETRPPTGTPRCTPSRIAPTAGWPSSRPSSKPRACTASCVRPSPPS
jgi:hypothetical protein